MGAVADSQHPWAFAFGILGNLISIMVYLAPVPTFYRIYIGKSTESFQSVPYLVELFSSTLWVYYAILKQNSVLFITINTFGSVMETLYIAMYIVYATNASRKFTIKLFGAPLTIVAQVIRTKSVEFMLFSLSFFLTLSGVSWFAYGLVVKDIFIAVIRTKSVEFMPFSLSFFLTLSGVLWFAYGLVVKDIFIAISYGLGFVLGLLQMLFYAIYRNRNEVIVNKEKTPPGPDHVTNAVILSTIATSKVHSVDAKSCDDNDVEDDKDGNKDSDSNEHKYMELG